MKKKYFILFLCLLAGWINGHAQNNAFGSSSILSTMPANEHTQFVKNMQAMGALSQNQLTAMAAKLKPYADKGNTSIQYALHGFAGYVMKPGRENRRRTAVQAYGKAISQVSGRMNKQFLIRQLQLIGKDDAVLFLQPCLKDSFLVHQAAQALATIATPDAKASLRQALEKATNTTRIPLVKALGDCRDDEAVKIIAPFAKSKNSNLKKTALYALANIANPSSAKTLLKAARTNGFHFENENATADCMLFVNRLIENDNRKAAKKMLKKLKRSIPSNNKTAHQAVSQFQKKLNHPNKNQNHNSMSDMEKKSGFVPLFNGKNLDGWTGNKAGYQVQNGVIAVHPGKGSGGNLYTENEYSNFILRFQFKLTPGANNGIGIRAPLKGDAAYVGMEIQVLDNTSPRYKNLHPYQYQGSVYGVIPAKQGYLKPVGQWNEEEIRADGTKIKVTLNGHVIVDGDIAPSIKKGTMDHKSHPGLKNKKGHIGFLGHGAVVYFKKLRIKKLP